MSFESATNHWLPTFPSVAIRVLEMMSDEDVAIVQMAQELKVDPVLTAKILHVANSPLFKSRAEIVTLEHAISWLGKKEIAGLVLSFKLATFASDSCREMSHFNDFWRQSFIQGCAMTRIAEASGQIQHGEAYICGILLDFGRLLLLDGYPGGYGKIIEESQKLSIPLHQLEQKRLGITHAEVGQELLNSLHLPERFGEVASLHTLAPTELDNHKDNPNFKLLAAAIVSSSVGDFFCRNNQGDSLSTIESVCRAHLQLTERDIQWLMDSVRDDIREKASLFSVDLEDMLPMGQLIGHANSQIEQNATANDETMEEEDGQLQLENKRLRQLVANLEDQVCKDVLTGIFNRDYFTGRFHERVHCDRYVDDSFAILMIDIDDFKLINDNHGHLAGDFAISWTARFIDAFFESGLVARYGGDEFVVLVDVESKEELEADLEKLCTEVQQQTPQATEHSAAFTISVGAVVCKIDRPHASLPMHIFNLADKAMYDAKKAGGSRGCVVSIDEIPDAWNGAEESEVVNVLHTAPNPGPHDTPSSRSIVY